MGDCSHLRYAHMNSAYRDDVVSGRVVRIILSMVSCVKLNEADCKNNV
jgi:hypothetical protein